MNGSSKTCMGVINKGNSRFDLLPQNSDSPCENSMTCSNRRGYQRKMNALPNWYTPTISLPYPDATSETLSSQVRNIPIKHISRKVMPYNPPPTKYTKLIGKVK